MAKRVGIPANQLKVLVWDAQVQVVISSKLINKADSKFFVAGECDMANKIITIHPKNGSIKNLLDTFVHEILHTIFGDDETLVEVCTKKVMRSLTAFERLRLFFKLAQSLKKVDI